MGQGTSKENRRFHTTNAQKTRVAEEVQRRRNAGEFISQNSVAEWAFKVLKLSVMPAQSTVSRLLKAKINL